jgi:hypothetical protein
MDRQFFAMLLVFALVPCTFACGPVTATGNSPATVAQPTPPVRSELAGVRGETVAASPESNAQPSSQSTPNRSTPNAPSPASQGKPVAGVADPAARAQEVLRQVREALGGEAALGAVQSFAAAGPFRRIGKDQEQSGEMRLELLMPDKLKITETLDLIAGLQLVIVNALNGDQAWMDSRSSAGNAQVMMLRRNDKGPQANDEQLKGLRANYTRYLLAFILTPKAAPSLEFSYAGEAEAQDGRADVLDVRNAAGFKARLFIDKKTRRPLMMTYRDVVMQVKTMKSSAGGADVNKIIKDAKAKPVEQQESDVQLYLADYRAEKGILFPRRFTKTVDGKPYEEWEVKDFKLNPRDLTAQTFEKAK